MTTTFLSDPDDAWRLTPFAMRMSSYNAPTSTDLTVTTFDTDNNAKADFVTFTANVTSYYVCWGGDGAVDPSTVGYRAQENTTCTMQLDTDSPILNLVNNKGTPKTTRLGTIINGSSSMLRILYFRRR